jgi:glutaconate CoA-transferase subunit A
MRLYTETGRAVRGMEPYGGGLRFRAGAKGVPFLPMRSMMGSDLIAIARCPESIVRSPARSWCWCRR